MKSSTNKNIIAFNGSPVKGGNTDLITREILEGAKAHGFVAKHIYLNDLIITPCQSCGKSPEPELCFYEDDLFPFLNLFAQSDIIVVSSPIYFDTVCAQTKLFIDRCNCFKPLEGYETGNWGFTKIDHRPRLGIIVLVGGEREKFQVALTVVRGLFVWTNTTFGGEILFAHEDYGLGGVINKPEILQQARALGESVAQKSLKG